MTDKELVKRFISEKVGPAYNVKTFAVLKSTDEVLAHPYSDDCVIKPTHLCGKVIFRLKVESKPPDRDQIQGWLDQSLYEVTHEPCYRDLEPKIIVEEYLRDRSGGIPTDYKVFCFNGVPAVILVCAGRFGTAYNAFYSLNWKHLGLCGGDTVPELPIESPDELPEMLEVAAALSQGCSFLRVDCYVSENGLKVGELTSFPMAGRVSFNPDVGDYAIGNLFKNPTYDIEAWLKNNKVH